jgi:hypothetical protein
VNDHVASGRTGSFESKAGKIVVEAPNLIVKNRQSTMKIGKYTRISSK